MEQSLIIKEKVLHFIAKLVEDWKVVTINGYLDDLCTFFIGEVRNPKLPISVAASCYYLLAVIANEDENLRSRTEEIQDILYISFKKSVERSNKIELKAVKYMVKAYYHFLNQNTRPDLRYFLISN